MNTNKSYTKHESWLENNFPEDEVKFQQLKIAHSGTVNDHSFLLPCIDSSDKWLTLGDCYGNDAAFLRSKVRHATAGDLQDSFLKLALNEGYIDAYLKLNAEKLDLADNSFDFISCREAYHHFPRPYIAVYEMLRCAKKGIIFQEPLDPFMKMPFLVFLCNLLDTKKNPTRSKAYWGNRFSFEIVGNYVYKVSQREFEKIAMGIGLPAVAFRYSNDPNTSVLTKLLSAIRLLPYKRLTAILFNELPKTETISKLKDAGFFYYELPKNPHL